MLTDAEFEAKRAEIMAEDAAERERIRQIRTGGKAARAAADAARAAKTDAALTAL